MAEEIYEGMTEEKWDAMYPNGIPPNNQDDDFGDHDQEEDANTGSSPADFTGDNGKPDETMQQGELQEPESQTQDEPVDDRQPANLKGEYYRKKHALEVMEANLKNQGILESQQSSESTSDMPPQPELPPPIQPKKQQEEIKLSETPTIDEFLALADQRVEQRVRQVIQQQQTEQRILSDYPDMLNPASPLFQWTQYELNTRYGNNMQFVEEATMRAASRLGIQAKSKQVTQPSSESRQKPLRRIAAQPPASERGTQPKQQGSKIKLSEASIRAAKFFGQNVKDVEAMAKRQKYTFASGESVFGE